MHSIVSPDLQQFKNSLLDSPVDTITSTGLKFCSVPKFFLIISLFIMLLVNLRNVIKQPV